MAFRVQDIFQGANRLIKEAIEKEHRAQGHHLTGASIASIAGKIIQTRNEDGISGYALDYLKTLNEGLRPEQIKGSMFPGLVRYFILRGLNPVEAKIAAGATFNKWKQEGMSTFTSREFSSTGERQHFIDIAFNKLDKKLNSFIEGAFEININEEYLKTKSETI